MPQKTVFSSSTLLKRIGLAPGNKSLVFFISLVAVTIPMGHVYNTFAIICFVLYSLLAARRQDVAFSPVMLLPMLLYALMALSLLWSPDVKTSAAALGKEAPLLFIPLAFCLSRRVSFKNLTGILKTYSIAMCIFGVYLMLRAFVRYFNVGDTKVFFYNEFAALSVSVYLSIFFSLALFVFLAKTRKTFWGYTAMAFLFLLVFLLSKRTIIVTDVFIIIAYYLFFSGMGSKLKLLLIGLFMVMGMALLYFGNITDQITRTGWPGKDTMPTHHNVGFHEAWSNQAFTATDNFSGPAFRVYQARVLKEITQESPIFFTGLGINISGKVITRKGQEHNLVHRGWEGVPYNKLNFHNQYMEAFADLGFFGLALVLLMVFYNLKRAIAARYFIHIAFAVLMITLFLAESFLWRQKGVVFFTLFYCLLNALLPLSTPNKPIDKGATPAL